MKTKTWLFFLIALLLLPVQALSKTPPIEWTPKKIEQTLALGDIQQVTTTLTSNTQLSNVDLWVVPALQPYVTVEPSSFATVDPGVPYTVTVTLSIPSDTQSGLHDGTVHARTGTETNARPLPIELNVVDAMGVIDSEGGTITTPNGCSINIPAGALSEANLISLTELSESQLPLPLPSNVHSLGAVQIRPDIVFDEPATLTIPIIRSFSPGTPFPLLIFNPTTNQYEFETEAIVNADSHSVSAQINHASPPRLISHIFTDEAEQDDLKRKTITRISSLLNAYDCQCFGKKQLLRLGDIERVRQRLYDDDVQIFIDPEYLECRTSEAEYYLYYLPFKECWTEASPFWFHDIIIPTDPSNVDPKTLYHETMHAIFHPHYDELKAVGVPNDESLTWFMENLVSSHISHLVSAEADLNTGADCDFNHFSRYLDWFVNGVNDSLDDPDEGEPVPREALDLLKVLTGLDVDAEHIRSQYIDDKVCGICGSTAYDSDSDCIPDDGDNNGIPGDNPCTTGNSVDCDDNCPNDYNPSQFDYDEDGFGVVCDCDDEDPNINPAAEEVCGDGEDNNCDRQVDEGCVIDVTVGAHSSHFSSGYYIQLHAQDPNHVADAITVTGPGIGTPLSLSYEVSRPGEWWSDPNLELGPSPPAPPLIYIFHILSGGIEYEMEAVVRSHVDELATELSAEVSPSGEVTFRWTGVNLPGVEYHVQLNDDNWNRIWNSPKNTSTSAVYDGDPLVPGALYHYHVSTQDSYGNESLASAHFVCLAPPSLSGSYDSTNLWNYLTWNPVSGADSYNVYWDTAPGVDNTSMMLTPTTTTDYAHSGVATDTSYYYRVAAVNADGDESELSDELRVMTYNTLAGHWIILYDDGCTGETTGGTEWLLYEDGGMPMGSWSVQGDQVTLRQSDMYGNTRTLTGTVDSSYTEITDGILVYPNGSTGCWRGLRWTDYDEDGVGDYYDNCVKTYNPNQTDIDNDKIGDACDANVLDITGWWHIENDNYCTGDYGGYEVWEFYAGGGLFMGGWSTQGNQVYIAKCDTSGLCRRYYGTVNSSLTVMSGTADFRGVTVCWRGTKQ